MERLSISSYLAHGYEFHLYTYGPVEGIPEGTTVLDAREIMPLIADQFQYLAQFSDIFRYHLIFKKGNYWVDLDTIMLRPFDDLTQEHIIQAYIKAPAGSQVLAWMIDQCHQHDWTTLDYGELGPALYSKTNEKFGLVEPKFPDILHCFHHDYWQNYIADPAPAIPEGCHAAHLFAQMWRWAKADVDAVYSHGCWYEQWKRRYL
jgi:hypothetical protein